MHVIIIGAGLQGVCTAYFLARSGADVTVIERRESAALETSLGNAGYIQVECPEIWNVPGVIKVLPKWWYASLTEARHHTPMVLHTRALLKLIPWGLRFLSFTRRERYRSHCALNHMLALYSVQQMAAVRERESIVYSRAGNGAIWVFRERSGIENYKPLLSYLGEQGAESSVLDRGALLELEPVLRPVGRELVGGIYFPRDESGDSYLFTTALADRCAAMGVRFVYDTEVRSIETRSGSTIVRTGFEDVEADATVIAAGIFSKDLAGKLGIRLPMAPAKGYSVTIPFGGWQERPRHMIGDMNMHAAVNPLGDVLRVAGTAQFMGYDLGVSQARIDYLLSLVEAVLPEFAAAMDRTVLKPFAGLRPLSADGLPMIGATKVADVYVNTGHGGLGWTQAVGSAKALADLMTGADDAFDLAPFSPQRF